MGITERREREKEEVRGRILDAARDLFARDGYDAVTMRKIAEAIEYSPTAIYLHFKDKDTLVRELCNADFDSLARAFQKIAREKRRAHDLCGRDRLRSRHVRSCRRRRCRRCFRRGRRRGWLHGRWRLQRARHAMHDRDVRHGDRRAVRSASRRPVADRVEAAARPGKGFRSAP